MSESKAKTKRGIWEEPDIIEPLSRQTSEITKWRLEKIFCARRLAQMQGDYEERLERIRQLIEEYPSLLTVKYMDTPAFNLPEAKVFETYINDVTEWLEHLKKEVET